MPLVPGHVAGVSVNACLMIGGIGTLIGAFHLFPLLKESIGWYLFAIGTFAASLATFWTVVLRGYRPGRSLINYFALASLGAAATLFVLALARTDRIGMGIVGVGLVFHIAAQRLIAGPSYALFTAFFRAKRAHEKQAHTTVNRS